MRVLCKHFRATLKTWQELFQDAADFASAVGREKLVSISHSQHGGEGIVSVWYWGEPKKCHKCGYDLTGNQSGLCPECGTQQSWELSPGE